MNRRETHINEIIEQGLGQFKTPPSEEMDCARQRILRRLRSEPTTVEVNAVRSVLKWPRFAAIAAAAAIVLVVFMQIQQIGVLGVVEATGEKIKAGRNVRADGIGSVLALNDGSRVEMKSESELSLERADDGVRIHLNHGGLIVSAAKQGVGHLYVQTRDVTVSVVGTVFLVNTEEAGSRVAVIQGEVQVEQGDTSHKLLPGEQVATNPSMDSKPVKEEIAWSPNAEAHLALLAMSIAPVDERSSGARNTIADSTPPQDAFEVATLIPTPLTAPVPCARVLPQQTGRGRFVVSDTTLYGIVSLAYGKGCLVLSGGPDWTKTDTFDIDALIADGYPRYTTRQLLDGAAPKLQTMIQSLLADRFKLTVHREMRMMRAYNLIAVKEGRNLKLSADQNPPDGAPLPRLLQRLCPCPPSLVGAAYSMSRLANTLADSTGRPVIDRTNLRGLYDLRVDYVVDQSAADPLDVRRFALYSAMEDQLGLRLEPARTLVEVLVIDRAEKPTEN